MTEAEGKGEQPFELKQGTHPYLLPEFRGRPGFNPHGEHLSPDETQAKLDELLQSIEKQGGVLVGTLVMPTYTREGGLRDRSFLVIRKD